MAAHSSIHAKSCGVTCGILALGGGVGFALVVLAARANPTWSRHRVPPTPEGMVFRVVLREDFAGFGPSFEFVTVDRDGPAIAIWDKGGQPGTTSERFREQVTIVRFPSGDVVDHSVDFPSALREELLAAGGAAMTFDFDGDGAEDRADCPDGGYCCVRSVVDDRVLWENDDPLEYEWQDRLTPLGDLDGDGFAELAVLHPRRDRSRYDFEPLDRLFGAKSWVSIVSGARVTRRTD